MENEINDKQRRKAEKRAEAEEIRKDRFLDYALSRCARSDAVIRAASAAYLNVYCALR